ncbi:MAG: copper resistance protein CopC [Aeromicrobium sp.]|uniref:copper resistance CopC family protein n=1 Tax=Aeromicrobium sp. TaxID=1871063 RepID=UPI0039E58395
MNATAVSSSVRLLAAAVVGLIVLAVVAPPAFAHAGIVSSNPAEGATLDALPARIELTFDEEMKRPSYVTVTAPDCSTLTEDKAEGSIEGSTVAIDVDDPGLAGTYRVDYRAVSSDAHPVKGSFEFDVTGGEEASCGALSKVSTTGWIALIAVPWIVFGALYLLHRRRSAA